MAKSEALTGKPSVSTERKKFVSSNESHDDHDHDSNCSSEQEKALAEAADNYGTTLPDRFQSRSRAALYLDVRDSRQSRAQTTALKKAGIVPTRMPDVSNAISSLTRKIADSDKVTRAELELQL